MATSRLPASWSNKNKVEWLDKAAYEALSRALNRAVADTGVNFSIWSAGRSKAEQERLFKLAYTPVSRGRSKNTDRAYQGRIWALKAGQLPVASPDYVGGSVGTHRQGRAVDIHPAAIQNWFKANGATYGWSWESGRKLGENHHFEYESGLDKMKHEGLLDHAAVQKVVGATVDGKIGTGTVAKIKAWQKSKGLTADGKVGAATKRAMGLAGKDNAAPAPTIPSIPVGGATVPAPSPAVELPPLPVVETGKTSPNSHKGRVDPRDGKAYTVKHITVHWWGKPSGQSFDGIVSHLCNKAAEVSAHYVISAGRVARPVDEADSSWANGNRVANFESITIECDPNDVAGTLPVLAALIADIRSRHGDIPICPHQHWTPTECPGDYLPHLDAVDQAARTGVLAPAPSTPPVTGGALPTGKELLMKLKDMPDFPLLRTPGNLCYYGGDSKITAVSGKVPNSLVPGEIFGTGTKSGAHGLKAWQKRVGITADGRYGSGTEAAAKALQRKAGLTVDGKIGPSTFYAAWLVG